MIEIDEMLYILFLFVAYVYGGVVIEDVEYVIGVDKEYFDYFGDAGEEVLIVGFKGGDYLLDSWEVIEELGE